MTKSKTNYFELGWELRDNVTGGTGIAIARMELLNGCVQYCIKPRADKDGRIHEGEWVDSQQLERVDEIKRTDVKVSRNNTGGYSTDAPRL